MCFAGFCAYLYVGFALLWVSLGCEAAELTKIPGRILAPVKERFRLGAEWVTFNLLWLV